MARKKRKRKVGSTFTRKVSRGPNKGDTVRFRVAPSGKAYPTRVLKDRGNNSTLKGQVRIGKKRKKPGPKKKKKRGRKK